MKKFLVTFFFFITLHGVTRAQVRYSFFAGPQLNTASYKINGKKQDTKFKPGFQLGAGLKVPFDTKLYFTPAVFYSLKGYKVSLTAPSFPPDSLAINNNVTVHSFELAFLLQYDFSEDADHFFLRAGPTLDFALFGREKFDRSTGGTVNRNLKFGFGDYGHYLASGIIHFGYETHKGYFIFAAYNGTLGSISNSDDGPVIKHRIVGISVGRFLK
ncbi:MAG: outer membrane beta-barrel protein [Terrimonas sp.]|nr:outer membrane beta-barrel protein [Terrimonas sp.]